MVSTAPHLVQFPHPTAPRILTLVSLLDHPRFCSPAFPSPCFPAHCRSSLPASHAPTFLNAGAPSCMLFYSPAFRLAYFQASLPPCSPAFLLACILACPLSWSSKFPIHYDLTCTHSCSSALPLALASADPRSYSTALLLTPFPTFKRYYLPLLHIACIFACLHFHSNTFLFSRLFDCLGSCSLTLLVSNIHAPVLSNLGEFLFACIPASPRFRGPPSHSSALILAPVPAFQRSHSPLFRPGCSCLTVFLLTCIPASIEFQRSSVPSANYSGTTFFSLACIPARPRSCLLTFPISCIYACLTSGSIAIPLANNLAFIPRILQFIVEFRVRS